MSDKIYVGSGKETTYGVSVSVCLTDLPPEFMFEYNDKKYIKLNIDKKREVDQYGKSHSVSVNTWKPNSEETPPETEDDSNGLPF